MVSITPINELGVSSLPLNLNRQVLWVCDVFLPCEVGFLVLVRLCGTWVVNVSVSRIERLVLRYLSKSLLSMGSLVREVGLGIKTMMSGREEVYISWAVRFGNSLFPMHYPHLNGQRLHRYVPFYSLIWVGTSFAMVLITFMFFVCDSPQAYAICNALSVWSCSGQAVSIGFWGYLRSFLFQE
jgi:hypothetical protein